MGLTTKVVRGERAERLLLLLHGLGADEQDLASLAEFIDPEGYFITVCPRGPYSYGPGFAWARIESPELREPTTASSLEAIEEVVEPSLAQYDMKREEMVVGGFSMGAGMALTLALGTAGKPRPAGVLVMSGFIASTDFDFSGELPPVLMQHGTSDPMIPVDRAREAAKFLQDNGVPVVYREYPMEHNVSPESARDAKEWLEQVRRGEKPSGIETQLSAPAQQAPPQPEGPVGVVNSVNFDAEVLKSDKPVIVDFWAPWCGPCRAVSPIVEQIAVMRKGSYKVVKCNIDESPDIAKTYDIKSIPLIGLFRNGRMERTCLGAKPRPQIEADLGMLVIP